MLLDSAPELVAKVVEMAKSRDATALRMCMDRLLSPLRSKDGPVLLDALNDSLAENSRAIVRAMADGAAHGAGKRNPCQRKRTGTLATDRDAD